jgi:hypothetical protein
MASNGTAFLYFNSYIIFIFNWNSFIYNEVRGNQLDSPAASATVLRKQRNVSFEPLTLEMSDTPSSSLTA